MSSLIRVTGSASPLLAVNVSVRPCHFIFTMVPRIFKGSTPSAPSLSTSLVDNSEGGQTPEQFFRLAFKSGFSVEAYSWVTSQSGGFPHRRGTALQNAFRGLSILQFPENWLFPSPRCHSGPGCKIPLV